MCWCLVEGVQEGEGGWFGWMKSKKRLIWCDLMWFDVDLMWFYVDFYVIFDHVEIDGPIISSGGGSIGFTLLHGYWSLWFDSHPCHNLFFDLFSFIDDSFDSFQYETNQVLINFNAHKLVGATCSQLYDKEDDEMKENEMGEEDEEMWKCLYGQYRFLLNWSLIFRINWSILS